ncbi:MAG TPA: glucose 1-dehydrogenase [Candidatus Dormibacteraeota bacterium]|nr:glucose 1-dehydrogenase [Candidatus Dormibacteraeota bacterium]
MKAGDPLFDLTGRVAVVTGASSGLGERFARVLRERGADVVIAARRAAPLAALATDLGQDHAEAVVTDVADEEALRALVERATGRFGRLDIMVNNAGISDDGPAEAESLEDFERVLKVNLTAVFTGSREAARVMLPSGRGSIINVASIAGFVSLSDRYPMAAYIAAKTGVVGLTRELGAQWAARGIRVNAIAPGWFPSEMTGQLLDADMNRWIAHRGPIGRPGLPHELDGALVFLASDASSYVVGQTIVVDGGWTLW